MKTMSNHYLGNLSLVEDIGANCTSFSLLYPTINGTEVTAWSIFGVHGVKKQILEFSLIVSSLGLVISFLVYAILPQLRTVPGKCLMGLVVSELATNLLLLAALQNTPKTPSCVLVAVLVHYFFLTILTWTNIIAFDIVKKLRFPNAKLRHFTRYIFFAYLSPLLVVTISLTSEHALSPNSHWSYLRPMYGQMLCGMGNQVAKLIFITLPASISLFINFSIFLMAIYKIKKITREITLNSIPSSIRSRFLWYLKLSILLGVSSFFGFLGNVFISRCRILNFLSIILNSLHGTFIFIAFTCKKSIFQLLLKHIIAWKSLQTVHGTKLDESHCHQQHHLSFSKPHQQPNHPQLHRPYSLPVQSSHMAIKGPTTGSLDYPNGLPQVEHSGGLSSSSPSPLQLPNPNESPIKFNSIVISTQS